MRFQTLSTLGHRLFVPLVFLGLAAVTLAVLVSIDGQAGANHDAIACNDDVPAGYTCVPLVNKPQSGPGVTTPAIGELFYQWVGTDTMRIAVRDIPVPTANTVQSGAQFCIDDDNEPYDWPTPGSNVENHCTGGSAAQGDVVDGSTGIPAAGAGEPDDDTAAGVDGEYEWRITGMVSDGTIEGLPYYQFNDMTGYMYFAYHVNIGDASTQAFWSGSPPSPTTAAPTTAAPTTAAPTTAAPTTAAPTTAAPTTAAPTTAAPTTAAPTTAVPTTAAPTTAAPTTAAPTPTATPTATDPATATPPTVTPTPTATPTPTTSPTASPSSPPPTDTPSPSPTALLATQTPAPTDTPAPTPTALPATATPADLPQTGGAPNAGASGAWLLALLAATLLLLSGGMGLAAARTRD
ncbi:MAG TPA: hypothetical protein VIT93_05160 [Dehalococcoidia bacterium]